jgi:hypothetical protein
VATDDELARALTRFGYEPTDDQVADRLVAELLRPGQEGGRPHPTWRGQLPGLHALAGELVGAARAGHHVSQATLARQSGLRRPGQVRVDGPEVAPDDRGRTTVMRTIHAWEALGLVTLIDDAGRPLQRFDAEGLPLPRGASFPKGSVPLYQVDVSWTPEMVASAPDGVRRRAAWAWAAWRAGAPDQLIAAAIGDPARGEARLRAWLGWREHDERRQRRRERRAAREAAARAGRPPEQEPADPRSAADWELIRGLVADHDAQQPTGHDPDTEALIERARSLLAEHDAEVLAAALDLDRAGDLIEEGELHTPQTELRASPHGPYGADGASALAPSNALAREARAAGPPPDDPRWVELDRDDVADRLVETITEGELLRAELYLAAGQLGEGRPELAWRQARNVARRCEVGLSAVVGEFVQASIRTLADVPVQVRAELREPVRCQATFAWGIVRRAFGLDRGPTRAAARRGSSRSSSGDRSADVVQVDVVDLVADVSGQLPLYEPEPEPTRRWTAEELRAIRERAEAGRRSAGGEDQVAAADVAPVGPMGMLLEQVRAQRTRS